MNNNYYKNLDENFTHALELYEQKHSHNELLELLKNGNIVQKQIAALKLETIDSIYDAEILTSNLIGQDGKIREAVALRLNEFMSDKKFLPYFQTSKNYKIFLNAITDINANICRNVISAISNLKNNQEFCNKFCPELTQLTKELLDSVEKFDFQDGKYKVNKEAFKLYWCLETIYIFYDQIDFDQLKSIILRSKDINEYTIREKAAKILSHKFKDQDLLQAKKNLQSDKNYYVRRF
ncbi:hypothetical protein IJ579_04330 [bacterium]|nr:hypothetical protein [bacterium]